MIAPPFIITEDEIEMIGDRLETALVTVSRTLTGVSSANA